MSKKAKKKKIKFKTILSAIHNAHMYFIYFFMFLIVALFIYVGFLGYEAIIVYKKYAAITEDMSKTLSINSNPIDNNKYKKIIEIYELERDQRYGGAKSDKKIYAKDLSDNNGIEIWGEKINAYDDWKNAIRNISYSFNQYGIIQWEILHLCAGTGDPRSIVSISDNENFKASKCSYPYYIKLRGKILNLSLTNKDISNKE